MALYSHWMDEKSVVMGSGDPHALLAIYFPMGHQQVKKLLIALLCMALMGCTSRTEFGPCVGAMDQGDPKLMYRASGWNIFVAVIFFETIVVPIMVVLEYSKCPEGKKAQ